MATEFLKEERSSSVGVLWAIQRAYLAAVAGRGFSAEWTYSVGEAAGKIRGVPDA